MRVLKLQPGSSQSRAGLPRVLRLLAEEATELFKALADPQTVISEVEHTQSLRSQADRIEAHDPGHAAMLRQRAAQIGLRR